MATIKEKIIKGSLLGAELRLKELKAISAPSCMIVAAEAKIEALKNGVIQVAHIEEFGHLEFTNAEVKTGRLGKKFVSFTTAEGVINFFPDAKFGPFISKQKDIQES